MPLEHDAAYTCPFCGKENHVGVDPTAGPRQRFTEDCPVCCSPISFGIRIEEGGDPVVESAERDD
jgi:transcription elongation factor Elf1